VITQQELAAWSKYAPWSDPHMVEQDYVICLAVAAIFEDGYLRSQVAMRGGTILHKGHLAPATRYSEDIDLVLVGNGKTAHVKKALARVLAPIVDKPTYTILADIRLTIRNLVLPSKILRQEYAYNPTSVSTTLGNLKVEVNINENTPFYPLVKTPMLVPVPGNVPRILEVTSYDLNEMLATKLRALLQREHGRDLFDLWMAYSRSQTANSNLALDPIRVGEAFRHYMEQEKTAFTQEQIRSELNRRLQSNKFRSDMKGFLANEVHYDIDGACADFCRVILPHL
jgi:predicted nucleotidyltransferase component of viral defense system